MREGPGRTRARQEARVLVGDGGDALAGLVGAEHLDLEAREAVAGLERPHAGELLACAGEDLVGGGDVGDLRLGEGDVELLVDAGVDGRVAARHHEEERDQRNATAPRRHEDHPTIRLRIRPFT